MIKFITSFVFVSLSLMAFSQSVVVSNTQTPTQLVNNVLLGMGVTASNITINGNPVNANAVQGNVASFTNTNPTFPISSGLLLTTGNAIAAQGPNNSTSLSNNLPATANVASDPHLNILAAGTVTNGVVLEFDFIPTGDTLNFRYIFGSEEYPEFSPSTFNDAFGLFLWGPGITGPYALAGYANGANIATIPGGIPVTINNVGDASNTQYYVFNDNGSTYGNAIQYDGTTVLLTAAASVQCNQTYHIKLAISNVSDMNYDSGVFLEANSFSSNVVDVAVATVSGDTTIVEGCNFADIVFTRPEGNMLDTLSIIYTIGGTATEGVDYANLMDTIIFLPGVDTVIVNLTPIQDNIIEGYESVIISVNIINPCGDTIVSSGTIYVWDGPIIDSLWSTNANCLPTGSVHVTVVAPSVPATYLWTSPNALTFSGPDWQNINPGWYYITVTQAQCSISDSVEVLLTAPPLANFSFVAPLSNCQPAEFSFVNNSLNATSYNWTFGDGNGSTGNNPSHTYSNQTFGTYTVQLIAFVDPLCASDTTLTINLDVCACIDPAALNFNALANVDDGSCIYPFPEVFAPNVFTPNSDAENPTYFLSGKNLVSLELTILNRWGAVVFSKSSSDLINNNPAWDGKINGDLATDGIYFYIYKATGITNQVVEGHGFMDFYT
ncbi:MAG: PKD domain-containing protein [Flavobacteriales bacterium]|nr:PKD domain-containing protein [Flavobacteriales bacterium]